jgi:hypothetical protein
VPDDKPFSPGADDTEAANMEDHAAADELLRQDL